MELEDLRREFQANSPSYSRLKDEVLFILEPALGETDIKLHSVSSRIKTLDSFLDKVEKRELKDPFQEISDIVGIRIVCLFLPDIARIAGLIRNSFSVVSEDNKVEGANLSSFGYMSVHFVVKLKAEYVGPRYRGLTELRFEIQVRTIAMDAWANVSHHLDYKSDKDVPDDLRRDFYALSGLFYVADKHFEMFYSSSKKSQARMTEFFQEATTQQQSQQEINLDTFKAFLAKKFPDRKESDADNTSRLITELLSLGYKTIGDVDELIEETDQAFKVYELDKPPIIGGPRFTRVGVVRISKGIKHDPSTYAKHSKMLDRSPKAKSK